MSRSLLFESHNSFLLVGHSLFCLSCYEITYITDFARVDFTYVSGDASDVPAIVKVNLTSPPVCTYLLEKLCCKNLANSDNWWIRPVFLEYLDRLNTKDYVDLELEWSTRDYPYPPDLEGWEQHEYAWNPTHWDTEKWDGKFQKVIISIPTDWEGDEPDVDAARFDDVEALARRLVGDMGTVTWFPFVFDYMGHGNET
ncbi:hypothetical protein IG631_08267 [Alternaria alternata]|nr:hypothetical protein IG631_08267 [Alternaria alternata]